MNDKPDPYQIWMSQSVASPTSPGASGVVASAATTNHRGFKIVATSVFVLFMAAAALLLFWRHTSQSRTENEQRVLARARTLAFAESEIARRAAAEAKALADLARQDALRAGDSSLNTAAVERAATGAAIVQEAADRAQAAVSSLRADAVTGSNNIAQIAIDARQAAESALERVRTDAAVVSGALEHSRRVAKESAESALLEKKQEQDRALQAEQERMESNIARSVNRSLWSPGSIPIIVVDASNQPLWAAADEIALRLSKPERPVLARLLTPALYLTPLASDLIEHGPAEVFQKLNIPAQRIIVGRVLLQSHAPDKFGFISADCIVSITIFTGQGAVLGTIRWESAGAGRDVRASTEEALTKCWSALDWTRFTPMLAP